MFPDCWGRPRAALGLAARRHARTCTSMSWSASVTPITCRCRAASTSRLTEEGSSVWLCATSKDAAGLAGDRTPRVLQGHRLSAGRGSS